MASPLSPGIGAAFNAALLCEIGAHVDGEIFRLYLAHQQEEECYLFLEPASRASTSLKPNASCRTTSLGKLPQEEGWGAHGGGGAGKVLTCLAEPARVKHTSEVVIVYMGVRQWGREGGDRARGTDGGNLGGKVRDGWGRRRENMASFLQLATACSDPLELRPACNSEWAGAPGTAHFSIASRATLKGPSM
jgi:hypothetical protein